MSCPCPFCPLIERNIQTCNVLVRITNKKKDTCDVNVGLPKDLTAGRTDEDKKVLSDAFRDLTLFATEQLNGECHGSWHNETAEFHLKKVGRGAWKVCFHAKSKEEDPK